MSTATHAIATPSLAIAGLAKRKPSLRPIRPAEPRHTTPEQARALQAISHAIEYLVDSRLFDTWQTPSDAEAVHILMASSREVFQECHVIKSWPQRLQQSLARRLNFTATTQT